MQTFLRKELALVFAATIGSTCLVQGAEAPVNLGSAGNFVALAYSTVTCTAQGGTFHGDIGVWPETAVTGFPPAICTGTIHQGNTTAQIAQGDLMVAYLDAQSRSTAPVTVAGNLGGQTLPPGLYKSESSLEISSGDLTLDAGGDSNAVWIFQIASTLNTTPGRKMILTGGALANNIFWQVGSSATFGTTSVVKGNILAAISISFNDGATLEGKALAMNGAVTLSGNHAIANPTDLPSSSLVITEVVEGTSANFKYIEIMNASTTATVDLSFPQMTLRRFSDGATAISLTGSIPPGGYFVIAHNQADLDAVYGPGTVTASQVDTNVNHDGNDSYDLFDGQVVDGFSKDWVTGVDPGAPAADGTFYRISSVLPNNGNWGGTSAVANRGVSPSGFWRKAQITGFNGNAAVVTSPFSGGGGGFSEPATRFSLRQAVRVVSSGEGYQELFYNYTTESVIITPYHDHTGRHPYDLPRDQWSGIFHYDYVAGRFTQGVYTLKSNL